MIYNFSKSHSFFYAIDLGLSFLTVEVTKNILNQRGILSRYFVQKLMLHVGSYDIKLLREKVKHNVSLLSTVNNIIHKIKKPWASDLDIEIFGFLLKHTNEIYDGELYLKGNNMELFHFLSCGPEVINIAQIKIQDNVNELEELIIKKKFIPFPLRPYHINMSDEEYPAKDGYKNNRQLNIIAQSILIHKNLVNVWKKIGYHEIVDDVNDLVFQSLLLLLFPPAPSSQTIEQTIEPKTEQVIQQLQEFIGLGF